jgi:hypothetical protein
MYYKCHAKIPPNIHPLIAGENMDFPYICLLENFKRYDFSEFMLANELGLIIQLSLSTNVEFHLKHCEKMLLR